MVQDPVTGSDACIEDGGVSKESLIQQGAGYHNLNSSCAAARRCPILENAQTPDSNSEASGGTIMQMKRLGMPFWRPRTDRHFVSYGRENVVAVEADVIQLHGCIACSLLRLEVYSVLLFAFRTPSLTAWQLGLVSMVRLLAAKAYRWVVLHICRHTRRLCHIRPELSPECTRWFRILNMITCLA